MLGEEILKLLKALTLSLKPRLKFKKNNKGTKPKSETKQNNKEEKEEVVLGKNSFL